MPKTKKIEEKNLKQSSPPIQNNIKNESNNIKDNSFKKKNENDKKEIDKSLNKIKNETSKKVEIKTEKKKENDKKEKEKKEPFIPPNFIKGPNQINNHQGYLINFLIYK